MNTILVPIDFSPCADNAMRFALEIARHNGAAIKALNVVYTNDALDNNMYNAFFIDTYLDDRRKAIEDWAKKFQLEADNGQTTVKISAVCQVGMPVSTICQVAKEEKVSLIVMGTTGATGLKSIFMGSTAAGVVESSRLPVLAVPEGAKFKTYARFVMATDFDMSVQAASLKVLHDLMLVQHTGLSIVHVLAPDEKAPDASVEDQLSVRLGGIPHHFHYLHSQNVPEAVSNFIEATECNGLVTIAHEHGIFYKLFGQSVTRALVQRTNVPILVLHERRH
jgi:nucleotide-binding universal stress UspA family protein